MESTDNLICPACDTKLTRTSVAGMEIDICQNGCGGIWFDKDELKKVDEKQENAGNLLQIQRNPEIVTDNTRERRCPKCGIKLFRHFSSFKMKIEVDECSKCEGFWLDANELDAIRNEFENEQEKLKASDEYFTGYAQSLNLKREAQTNADWEKAGAWGKAVEIAKLFF